MSELSLVVYVHMSKWGTILLFYSYRAETCSCIPTVLLDEIELCSTVCVIHKNSLLLNQHNGDDAPKNTVLTSEQEYKMT